MNSVQNQVYLVSCPNCGKINQKSRETESIIVCGRCKFEYYHFLKNGVSVTMPSDHIKSKQLFGQFKTFALAIDKL